MIRASVPAQRQDLGLGDGPSRRTHRNHSAPGTPMRPRTCPFRIRERSGIENTKSRCPRHGGAEPPKRGSDGVPRSSGSPTGESRPGVECRQLLRTVLNPVGNAAGHHRDGCSSPRVSSGRREQHHCPRRASRACDFARHEAGRSSYDSVAGMFVAKKLRRAVADDLRTRRRSPRRSAPSPPGNEVDLIDDLRRPMVSLRVRI